MCWYCTWQHKWLPNVSYLPTARPIQKDTLPKQVFSISAPLQFSQNQQRWSFCSQQPLRGALGYRPSICTVPFDSNEPISSTILGAILQDGRDIFSSCCNSNCSCSQLLSVVSALILTIIPLHTHTTASDETNVKNPKLLSPAQQEVSGLDLVINFQWTLRVSLLGWNQCLFSFPPASHELGRLKQGQV